ncbi:MAG: LPS export ABC transporter periplasmic protein LptC [Francisella sp.]
MKFFTKYSLFTNLFSLIVIIFSIIYISNSSSNGGISIKNIPQNKQVDLKAFDFNYNKYNEDGNLVTSFFAKKLKRYLNQDIQMTDITVKSYDENTEKLQWQVIAKSGYQKNNKDLIHLYNGINAIIFSTNNDNEQKKSNVKNTDNLNLTSDKVYIQSSEIFYNSKSKDFYNKRFTKMYDPKTGNNITGTGVTGNAETKIVKLNKDVRSYYAFS